MGLPSIDITFKTSAATTIAMGDKGTVALILKDSAAAGAHRLTAVSQIPAALSADNKAYVQRAFIGYVNPPKCVLLFVLGTDAENLDTALTHFATQQFDYLCAPPDASSAEATAVKTWIAAQRAQHHLVKAVLPDIVADSDAVVNFTADGMTDGATTYVTAAYCSRIAGILAGTPWTMSATYAPLEELTDVTRMSNEQADAAIDAGQLILIHDGRKVKVGRAVNSMTTVTADHSAPFKKIKIVEVVDRIETDLRAAVEDGFIGKYANSYSNKMLLVTAIRQYLHELEVAGILQADTSTADINTTAIRSYLDSQGVDVSGMSDDALRQYNTGSQVFLAVSIKIMDAIEDVTIAISM